MQRQKAAGRGRFTLGMTGTLSQGSAGISYVHLFPQLGCGAKLRGQ